MKKCISILLLLVVLVTGAHPVLAFHFCGGELYSFGMAGSGAEISCCSSEDAPTTADSLSQSRTSCCNIQKISISTDSYQSRTGQSSLHPQTLPFGYAPIMNEHPFGRSVTDIKLPANNAFPPGGLAIRHIDILTGICIFRI